MEKTTEEYQVVRVALEASKLGGRLTERTVPASPRYGLCRPIMVLRYTAECLAGDAFMLAQGWLALSIATATHLSLTPLVDSVRLELSATRALTADEEAEISGAAERGPDPADAIQ